MPSATTNLSPDEHNYIARRIAAERISLSSYLRRLVQTDMHRADSDALTALSLDTMAETQQAHARSLTACQGLLQSGFQLVSDQLNEIILEQARSADYLLQSNTRLLGAHDVTADLVVAALQECHDILDADNTLLEAIDRRIKALGK